MNWVGVLRNRIHAGPGGQLVWRLHLCLNKNHKTTEPLMSDDLPLVANQAPMSTCKKQVDDYGSTLHTPLACDWPVQTCCLATMPVTIPEYNNVFQRNYGIQILKMITNVNFQSEKYAEQ